jgi:hypothetical protein
MEQSNASTHAELSSSVKSLNQVLNTAPSNDFGPAWRQVLDEIGASELLGHKLLERVTAVLEKNALTIAMAHEELGEIVRQFSVLNGAVDHAVQGLQQLRVGTEELKPGEIEIEILIPKEQVSELGPFGRDLQRIETIFKVFSEVATGKPGHFEVQRLSSSNFLVDLVGNDLVTIWMIAKSLEWVLDQYKKVVEIRKAHKEIRKFDVPDEVLAPLRDHAENLIRKQVEERVPVLLQEHYREKGDDGRRNELGNGLSWALLEIAGRIDRGYGFDVRVGEISESKQDDPEEEVRRAKLQDIKNIEKTLQYFRPDGPPILALPASTPEFVEPTEKPPVAAPPERKGRRPRKTG